MSEAEQGYEHRVTGKSTVIVVDGYPIALETGEELRRAFETRPYDDKLAHDVNALLDQLRQDDSVSEDLLVLLGGRVVQSADGKWMLETLSEGHVFGGGIALAGAELVKPTNNEGSSYGVPSFPTLRHEPSSFVPSEGSGYRLEGFPPADHVGPRF